MHVQLIFPFKQLTHACLCRILHCCLHLQLSFMLGAQGIQNALYHKNVPKDERDAALAAFADTAAGGGGGNVVIVSTDAAARGIDLPDVTHVVQVGLGALDGMAVCQ
jgi:superfamily II helicase